MRIIMHTVTAEQAYDTYKRTVRDEPREAWALWVLAIHNSLTCGKWIGGDNLPGFAKEAYELVKADGEISYADEKDRP